MKILNKLLDLFAPDGNNDNKLTNKQLLKELVSQFKEMLEAESVGRKMLYPMSFHVIMDPDDYNSRKQSLPYVLPEVISAYYQVIKDKQREYPDFTPPAKYWYFQFSSSRINTVLNTDSTPLTVEKGHIVTIASLITNEEYSLDNVTVDTNVRMSVKLDNSFVDKTNMNWTAIQKLDILGEGIFKYEFDKNLSQDIKQINEKSNIAEFKGLAELSYTKNGVDYRYTMRNNLIHISGKNDIRDDKKIFKLDSTEIKDSHIQIKYVPSEGKYYIAAFAQTNLNSRIMEESSGGEIKWYALANKSSIFVNNEIKVNFEIIK